MIPRNLTVNCTGAALRRERRSQASGFIFISRMLSRLALRRFAQQLEEIQKLVLAQASQLDKCAGHTLAITASFKTLELDSLDAVELVTSLEDKLGVSLQDSEVKKLTSLSDVASAFHSKLNT